MTHSLLTETGMGSAVFAEQSVLGALLLKPAVWDDVADVLEAGHFLKHAHQVLYRAYAALYADSKTPDIATLSSYLTDHGQLDQVGGLVYMAELARNVPSAANVRQYAELVREYANRRAIVTASQDIAEIALADGPQSSEERLRACESVLAATGVLDSTQSGSVSVTEALTSVVDYMTKREAEGGLAGLSTGFADLDRMTGGMMPGELWGIAGRPAMGKTTVAMNIAEHVAATAGHVLFVSLEMPAMQLGMRIAASQSGVPLDQIKGEMHEDSWTRLSAGVEKAKAMSLEINERAHTASKIYTLARRLKREKGLKLVVIDYIGLMQHDQRNGANLAQAIGATSAELKRMAKDIGIPVIILAQLNRDVAKQSDKRPHLHDLRDSGAIEQDLDVAVFVHREEYYNPDDEYARGIGELIIRKQRMGETGTVHVAFQGAYCRFKDLAALPAGYGQAKAVGKKSFD